eukprot:s6795_g4.t1
MTLEQAPSEDLKMRGPPVRKWLPFGTPELSAEASKAAKRKAACLQAMKAMAGMKGKTVPLQAMEAKPAANYWVWHFVSLVFRLIFSVQLRPCSRASPAQAKLLHMGSWALNPKFVAKGWCFTYFEPLEFHHQKVGFAVLTEQVRGMKKFSSMQTHLSPQAQTGTGRQAT